MRSRVQGVLLVYSQLAGCQRVHGSKRRESQLHFSKGNPAVYLV